MSQETYWNGEPTPCWKVIVVVGRAPDATCWFVEFEGRVRKAVEVCYEPENPFYLDNEDGEGWNKVTLGMGSPDLRHKSLMVDHVLRRY